jgi:hypothetical protein
MFPYRSRPLLCPYPTSRSAKSTPASDPTIGDCWTWTAVEAESKLLISYLVGGRDAEFALMLMDDLRGRLANRVQLTTDGHTPYLRAVEEAFGADIDYSMLVKLFPVSMCRRWARGSRLLQFKLRHYP